MTSDTIKVIFYLDVSLLCKGNHGSLCTYYLLHIVVLTKDAIFFLKETISTLNMLKK